MKHKLLTLASAAALLAACSDTSVSDANDEIKEKGTVTFFVYDVLTRMPLEDVANYYRTEDKTKYTDSTGTIVWKDVDIGQSYFDFQLDGYAMKRHDVKVTDKIQRDVARVEDNVEKVPMYELGVDVKGQFFYRDAATKDWVPAANATVYIDYPDSSEIYPNEVYTKTDENGFYTFKNLASNVGFEVWSERFTVDSTVYEVAKIGGTAQRKGVLKEMEPMIAEIASLEPVLLSSNLSNLGVKDDIKLNFSEVLEKDSVTTKHIFVNRMLSDSKDPVTNKPNDLKPVAVSVSLSEDGKTVIIKSKSGEWADGKSYVIDFDVWSTLTKGLRDSVNIDGVDYKKYRKFTAGALEVPGQVKNLHVKLDDDDNEEIAFDYIGDFNYGSELNGKSDLTYSAFITLEWDAIEKGVEKYNIYVKGDKDANADYVKVDEIKATKTDVEEKTIDLSAALNNGNYLLFPQNKLQSGVIDIIVLPENASGEALAKDAKALTIKTFDAADGDIWAMQTSEFITAAKIDIKKTGNSVAYICTGSETSTCTAPVTKTNPLTDGDKYGAVLRIDVTINKDAAKMKAPTGYEIYAELEDAGWVKCDATISGVSADIAMDDACSPFKDGAREYAKTDAKDWTFVVVPYFGSGKSTVAAHCADLSPKTETECLDAGLEWIPTKTSGYKISQTELNAKKGVYATSEDFQDYINSVME